MILVIVLFKLLEYSFLVLQILPELENGLIQ